MKPLNDVIAACPPSGIRRFFDIAAEMDDVISLGVGEPDFVTPWRMREAGIYALEHGYTTYTSNAGLPELRELICADLAARYGARLRLDRRVPDHHRRVRGAGPGAAGAAQPRRRGDRPGALLRRLRAVRRVRGRGARCRCRPAGRTTSPSTPAAVAAAVTPRTKAILLGSPANPTGAVQPRVVAGGAGPRSPSERDLYLVSDEIYDRLTYDGRAHLPGHAARSTRAHRACSAGSPRRTR